MKAFIDIHCHILPNFDDGPDTFEKSMDMLRIASSEGFTDIVVTPHYAPQIPGFHSTQDIAEAMKKLQKKATIHGIHIKLHTGSEIRLDEHSYQNFLCGNCLPIGNTRYVLLELPDSAYLDEHLDWAMPFINNGWIPILAHVERLHSLQTDIEALTEWTNLGCLLQVNASSVEPFSSLMNRTDVMNRTARQLIKKGLCHIIATDAHSSVKRAPTITKAYDIVTRWIGKDGADKLFISGPRRILEPVYEPAVTSLSKST